jgi:SNF2 family DNA or RNA helicase
MSNVLRVYQIQDIEFSLSKSPVRILNMNDTGLGKTVETVVTIAYHPRNERVVVMCGKSLLTKWAEEFRKWGKMDNITIVSGETKGGKKGRADIIDGWSQGVLIVNYETMKTYLHDRGKLFTCDWFVIDEAHKIKNRKSQITTAIHQFVHAENRVLLTATPTDGNPSDYWALLAFLFPNRYTSFWQFSDKYCRYIDNGFTTRAYAGPRNTNELKKELAPFTICRPKREVLADLPPVTTETISFDLPKKLTKTHKAIKVDGLAKDDKGGLIIADNPLAKMVKLRQLCSVPAILDLSDTGPKWDYLTEVIEGASRPIVVYSPFEESVSRLAASLPCDSVAITGQTTTTMRDRAIKAVNEGQTKVCFITDAGGLGIDLIGADRLIFYDLPLSQIMYHQVLGRVDRIGQENPVLISRLVTNNTIEQRLVSLLDSKIKYTDQMLIDELSSWL